MTERNDKIIIYNAEDGQTKIDVRLEGEMVWLNAQQMADLLSVDRTGIVKHVQNVLKTGELPAQTTCAKFALVAKDGKTRFFDHYNLDMIISVGYRVNSIRGTQFRIWATKKLREYIIKGFVMDDDRLAEGKVHKTYFEEWEERIRRISGTRNSRSTYRVRIRINGGEYTAVHRPPTTLILQGCGRA